MDNQDRLAKLFGSFNFETGSVLAGSLQGQFPILDLLGNMRDEAAARPGLAALQKVCANAWERMVGIVESGQPFAAGDIAWLKELTAAIAALVGPAGSFGAPPLADFFPLPPSAAPSDLKVEAEDELPLILNLADDADLLREFITESREHLDHIEHGVLVLEHQPADAEMLSTVFRAFHTFKGGAGFLNLIPINRLAHALESLLDLARQGRLTIDAPVIELILRGRDVLKQFLDEIEGQIAGTRPVAPILISTAVLKAEVQEAIDHVGSGKAVGNATQIAETPLLAQNSGSENLSAALAAAHPAAARDGQSAMVKVDTAKLDSLLDLVGEMVIAQSLVSQDLGREASVNPQSTRNLAQLARITKELQRVSMAMRMVPIRSLFQKMARVAHDLGAKQRKKIQFLTSGDDTELDRSVVEELSDPLLHMIRNSVDHGIESPDQRAAAGKPSVGTLQLRAFHQGGNILVEISDDGAGLNRDRILRKAVERGLISASATPTDEEIFNCIFAAGFSTAEKITDISGRGVGLDVVRRNLERLRGRVDISSEPGKGTRFTITLPLTLAIIDGLIVRVGGERYIIPTLSVRESFRLQAGMITRVQNRAEIVNVRGRHLPLLRLHELFGIPQSGDARNEGIGVVVQSGTGARCLFVDALLHRQEVVIKNLNDMMVHKNRSLAGAAILGDGRVGLILDVNALVHLEPPPVEESWN
jgi:two-component system chemotaxis sensor kinase CheA